MAKSYEHKTGDGRHRCQVSDLLLDPLHSFNNDFSAWAEIHDVFGDGHEYDWALEDDEPDLNEEQSKPELKYQDVCISTSQ